MALPNGLDVALFLGRTQDTSFVLIADQAARMTYEYARAFTRGHGFEDDDEVSADLKTVIVGAAARLATNPTIQRGEQSESYASSSGPDGEWTKNELWILQRYRRTTA